VFKLSTPPAPSKEQLEALGQLLAVSQQRKAAEQRQRRMTMLWVLVSAIAVLIALSGWL
jgi:predicted nucleic acid-binding Zn ribbon protein